MREKHYLPDCSKTSQIAAFLLRIPQNKATVLCLIVVDTVWSRPPRMLLKTLNNRHFEANNLLTAALPNLAVTSAGCSFSCDSFTNREEMKSEGFTYKLQHTGALQVRHHRLPLPLRRAHGPRRALASLERQAERRWIVCDKKRRREDMDLKDKGIVQSPRVSWQHRAQS